MKRTALVVVTIFAALWIMKEVLLPVGVALLYSNEYMELTVACDIAMDASWYYRQDDQIPAESEIVQLVSCHEYDKTRKLLLMAGLPESYLAWLGLKSLELYQRPPEEFVKQHRFEDR